MTPIYVWILIVQVCTSSAGLDRCVGRAVDGPFSSAVECEFYAERRKFAEPNLVCVMVPS